MKLGDYLEKNGIKAIDFAPRIDMSRSGLSRLLSGESSPSVALALRIHEATKGAVTLPDWGKPPRKRNFRGTGC